MISSIDNGISAIKLFNATNAFKANPIKQEQLQNEPLENDLGTDIQESSMLQDIDVDEIKQFAQQVGDENFSDDDIKYGLKYGRSVLMDCSA